MELQGKRIAVLIEDNFDEQEFYYPTIRMREAGATVTVVGPKSGYDYKSKHSIVVKSDKAASEVSADDFDAVIVPGGMAPDKMRRDKPLLALVHDAYEQGKVVAAICHAGWVLVSARILRGRTVTGAGSIRDDLENAGATFVDEEVVRDGNLISSRSPADLPAFSRTIIAALTEEKEAVGAGANGRQATHG